MHSTPQEPGNARDESTDDARDVSIGLPDAPTGETPEVVPPTNAEQFAHVTASNTESDDDHGHQVSPVPYDEVAEIADAITSPGEDRVPPALHTAGSWAWRIIAVIAATAIVGFVVIKFSMIIIALMVSLLLAVILEPLSSWLKNRWNWPSAAASAFSLIGLIVIITGLLVGSGTGIIAGFRDLSEQVTSGIDNIVEYITTQFPNFEETIDGAWASAQNTLTDNSSQILGGVMSVGSSVTGFLTGLILSLFALFFFLKDGRRLWHWLVRLAPVPYQNRVNESGIRAWMTIGNYTRTQAIVALVDAVGIALIAFLLKTPLSLAFPIGVIVFLAAFIPIVGAFLSGFIAVLVVLVNTQSIGMALIMLAGIIIVQQVEGNVLQPVLQGNALNMHALAIVLIVTGGSVVAGIVGALFTVPIAAAINTAILYLRGHDIYPYLDRMENRPGGPPRDFSEYKEEYWEMFDRKIAQHVSPKERRKQKKLERAKKRAAKASS